MNQEKLTVPTNLRGLRILLIDSDTESLLHLASKLENCSYSHRVTTTELPTIALSILQERADRFDLIMAEIEMPEMDCFSFINSVQLIKDLPIILISAESKKNVIEEALRKGVCFFLKKPISSKNLKNAWQHVYRKTREREAKSGGDDEEAESQEAEADKKEMAVAVNNHGMRSQRAGKKRCASSENIYEEVGERKRRKKDGNQELMAGSPDFETAFLDMLGSY